MTDFFDILVANISWTVAQTPTSHIIFWKTVIKTFRSIYVNCFNTLRFLAEVSTKLQKMHFLDNLRTITQEGSTETRQMTPFLSTFSDLTVCNIHYYIWKWSKFIFLWSSLWSLLICKIPQFWAKATDSDSHSEVDNLRFLKSILCVVPQGQPKKYISLLTNTSVQRCLYPLFQIQSPYFLLSSLFWKLSQSLGQDQQNSKQIYCQVPIIIFLWTVKGFICPEYLLNFLMNLYIPPWLRKSFKFIMLWVL